jgi:hypothetical protein
MQMTNPTPTQSGKAFEYALAMAPYDKVKNAQRVRYVEDRHLPMHGAVLICLVLQTNKIMNSANAAVRHI